MDRSSLSEPLQTAMLSLCIKETSQVDQHDSGRYDMFNMCVIIQIP